MAYWVAWLLTYMGNIVVIALLSTAILKVGGVLPYTSSISLFLLFCLYGLSLFSYAILISTLSNSSALASLIAALTFFSTAFLD